MFRKELLKSREAMSVRDVGIQGGGINGDKQEIRGKGLGKEPRSERKWLESLMSEGRDWTMGWKWKSTKVEIHSVTE